MGMAFGISEEDVANVLRHAAGSTCLQPGESVENAAERILNCLDDEDLGRIERAALRGDDLDEQTESAYGEIRALLVERGEIRREPVVVLRVAENHVAAFRLAELARVTGCETIREFAQACRDNDAMLSIASRVADDMGREAIIEGESIGEASARLISRLVSFEVIPALAVVTAMPPTNTLGLLENFQARSRIHRQGERPVVVEVRIATEDDVQRLLDARRARNRDMGL